MSFANSSTVRYSLRRNDGAAQFLQVRLGYLSRLISRSPSVGLPYEILRETSWTSMADALFPLPLRELEDPFFCHAYIVQLLSSFNLGAVTCNTIGWKITSFVVQLAAGNYEVKFHIVADIDYIQMFWIMDGSNYYNSGPVENGGRGRVMVEETVVLDEAPARRGAPAMAIERLKKGKFDGFGREALENCSVCYDELNNDDNGKEVSRIPCGHVYHKSCILTWIQRNNSCPLCRRKVEEE